MNDYERRIRELLAEIERLKGELEEKSAEIVDLNERADFLFNEVERLTEDNRS